MNDEADKSGQFSDSTESNGSTEPKGSEVQQIWEGCRVAVYAADASLEWEDDDVEVKQRGERLEILYWDEEGPVLFGGRSTDDGLYELVCRSRPRTATLRWSEPGRRLEGSWEQGEESGSWQIVLGPVHPEGRGVDS